MIENNASSPGVGVFGGVFGERRLWRVAGRCPRIRRRTSGAPWPLRHEFHRFCGQLCGQPGVEPRQGANFRAPEQVAQSLSMKKSLKINELLGYDSVVTRVFRRSRTLLRTVEFLHSTERGAGA
jgi:hypothetical protein